MDFKLKKSDLNFRVYTASSIPATGTENDIVVISEVPMTNWILSPDEPSGVPRTDGDVWIQYSVSGNAFNVLKNSTMMLTTIRAWQYVENIWVDVIAMSYQNGEWTDWWDGILYDSGDEFEVATGGWGIDGYTNPGGSVREGTRNADSFYVVGVSGSPTVIVMFGTLKPINVDRFTTLHIDGQVTGSHANGASLAAVVFREKAFDSSIRSVDFGTNKSRQVFTIDLSDVGGDVYIVFHAQLSPSCKGYLYRMWLT